MAVSKDNDNPVLATPAENAAAGEKIVGGMWFDTEDVSNLADDPPAETEAVRAMEADIDARLQRGEAIGREEIQALVEHIGPLPLPRGPAGLVHTWANDLYSSPYLALTGYSPGVATERSRRWLDKWFRIRMALYQLQAQRREKQRRKLLGIASENPSPARPAAAGSSALLSHELQPKEKAHHREARRNAVDGMGRRGRDLSHEHRPSTSE
jgi:hypothetical protein